MLLGLWQDGASLPFAGEPTLGIVAFALAPNGTFAYVALPLTVEGAAPEIYTGSLDGGAAERVATLSTDTTLVLNPTATSMTISADGARIALSTPEQSEPTTAVKTRSFGIDLSTGHTYAYAGGDFGLDDASISPDGSKIVLFEPDGRQLMIAEIAEPSSLRQLGAPLQVSPGEPVAWSPDGTHMAYADLGPAGHQAHVRSVDGGDPVQVTTFEGGLWNSAIRWVD